MAVILWEGPSVINGDPIVLLATTYSRNEKTGNMVQTYILRQDIPPLAAVRSGMDDAICGDCDLRGDEDNPRLCYVLVHRAPTAIWTCYTTGRAERRTPKQCGKGREIRVGAYGDPAAVPFEVWQELLSKSTGHTGYTHAWRYCDPRFKTMVHASCSSLEAYQEAKAAGWMTYRTRLPEEPRLRGERPCPAAKESGAKVTCSECLGCNGQRRDFTVVVHGKKGTVEQFRRFRLATA